MNNIQLNERINELWTRTKAEELPREERFVAIETLTEEYFAATGKRPDVGALDRLATLCLYEELTDNRSNKMREEENPVMSDNQYRRRKEGKHVRSELSSGEVTMKRASEYGTDMRFYGDPKRRQLSTDEAIRMDTALPLDSTNAERYIEQARNGMVVVSHVY